MWLYTLVIPTLRRKREEDQEFKASLGYRRKTLSTKIKNKNNLNKTKTCNLFNNGRLFFSLVAEAGALAFFCPLSSPFF
jgi:hypothetical protein